MSNELAPVRTQTSLVAKMAGRFGVDPDKLLATLKGTCFKTREAATNEQMVALLVVADQYRLNPFTKELFAFEDKHKGIVPVVSVDGWARIINEHEQYDGIEFTYSENVSTPKDGKPCPEWCEVRIYRKDRSRPTIIREYLDEVYQPPRNGFNGPWQTHTKRFLRHKTLIQGARVAFGFAGIYDEDEAVRIIDATPTRIEPAPEPNAAQLTDGLRKRTGSATPGSDQAEPIDVDPAANSDQAAAGGELTPLALLVQRMSEATTRDRLDQLADEARELDTKEERMAANAAYNEHLARLESGFGQL